MLLCILVAALLDHLTEIRCLSTPHESPTDISLQIYKCQNPACPPPTCYRSYPSSKEINPKCERPGCDSRMDLIRHVSFVGECGLHDMTFASEERR